MNVISGLWRIFDALMTFVVGMVLPLVILIGFGYFQVDAPHTQWGWFGVGLLAMLSACWLLAHLTQKYAFFYERSVREHLLILGVACSQLALAWGMLLWVWTSYFTEPSLHTIGWALVVLGCVAAIVWHFIKMRAQSSLWWVSVHTLGLIVLLSASVTQNHFTPIVLSLPLLAPLPLLYAAGTFWKVWQHSERLKAARPA